MTRFINKKERKLYNDCYIFDIIINEFAVIEMINPENIKALRLKLVLTQTEFAQMLGVSFATVNRYENGKSIPTIKIQRVLLQLMKKNHII